MQRQDEETRGIRSEQCLPQVTALFLMWELQWDNIVSNGLVIRATLSGISSREWWDYEPENFRRRDFMIVIRETTSGVCTTTDRKQRCIFLYVNLGIFVVNNNLGAKYTIRPGDSVRCLWMSTAWACKQLHLPHYCGLRNKSVVAGIELRYIFRMSRCEESASLYVKPRLVAGCQSIQSSNKLGISNQQN